MFSPVLLLSARLRLVPGEISRAFTERMAQNCWRGVIVPVAATAAFGRDTLGVTSLFGTAEASLHSLIGTSAMNLAAQQTDGVVSDFRHVFSA